MLSITLLFLSDGYRVPLSSWLYGKGWEYFIVSCLMLTQPLTKTLSLMYVSQHIRSYSGRLHPSGHSLQLSLPDLVSITQEGEGSFSRRSRLTQIQISLWAARVMHDAGYGLDGRLSDLDCLEMLLSFQRSPLRYQKLILIIRSRVKVLTDLWEPPSGPHRGFLFRLAWLSAAWQDFHWLPPGSVICNGLKLSSHWKWCFMTFTWGVKEKQGGWLDLDGLSKIAKLDNWDIKFAKSPTDLWPLWGCGCNIHRTPSYSPWSILRRIFSILISWHARED